MDNIQITSYLKNMIECPFNVKEIENAWVQYEREE